MTVSDLRIVYRGTSKKGNTFTIRYPIVADSEAMWKYINILSQERTYIRFQGEELPREEEDTFVVDLIKKIENRQALTLLAFHNDTLIGNSGITMHDKIDRHIGEFGISMAKDYRDEGIGSFLMDSVINEAVNHIPALEIVSLTIFANNERAQILYEKKGFIQYGNLPKGIKLEQGYVDHEFMYKVVRENKNKVSLR